jgi:hypothetical protein
MCEGSYGRDDHIGTHPPICNIIGIHVNCCLPIYLDSEMLRIERFQVNGYNGTKEDPVILGSNTNFTIDMEIWTKNTVLNGEVQLVVFFKNVAPIFSKKLSVCDDLLPQSHEACPIGSGSHNYQAAATISEGTPHGDYRVRISVFANSLPDQMVCRDLYVIIH